MSIAPPSDIVLDVAQAADPQRLQVATAKLAQLAAGQSVDFNDALDKALASPKVSSRPLPPTVPNDRPAQASAAVTPYQKFEAVVLQNFVETMLPKNNDLFGDAASAGPLRSMLAEQVATQLAKTGKIGIARAIEKAHGAEAGAGQPAGSSPASIATRALDRAQESDRAQQLLTGSVT